MSDKITTTVKITKEAHRALKILAVRHDTSVSHLLEMIADRSAKVEQALA